MPSNTKSLAHQLFVQQSVQDNKNTHQTLHYWTFVKENQWSKDSPHKRPTVWKEFPCHCHQALGYCVDMVHDIHALDLDMVFLYSMQQYRVDSRFVPSQWETALLCNDVSHWLGTSLESAPHYVLYLQCKNDSLNDRMTSICKENYSWMSWQHSYQDRTWTSNYIHVKPWDLNTHPCLSITVSINHRCNWEHG